MARSATNTLIITQVPDELLKCPKLLIEFLSKHEKNCELISLIKFGRILLICKDNVISQQVLHLLRTSEPWSQFYTTYSIQDNEFAAEIEVEQQIDYLELPSEEGSKRFLISPPLSPPPEWEHWSKVEDGPNKQTMHNPQELSDLLWERLGGIESKQVRKYQDTSRQRDLNIEPQVLFEDVSEDVPVILLDQVDPFESPLKPNKPVYKTQLPPIE